MCRRDDAPELKSSDARPAGELVVGKCKISSLQRDRFRGRKLNLAAVAIVWTKTQQLKWTSMENGF